MKKSNIVIITFLYIAINQPQVIALVAESFFKEKLNIPSRALHS